MKRILFLIIILASFYKICLADTICYWHVSYNNEIIKRFSETTVNPEITIKFKNLKSSDYLTTRFFKDTPCKKCYVDLEILDDNNILIVKRL